MLKTDLSRVFYFPEAGLEIGITAMSEIRRFIDDEFRFPSDRVEGDIFLAGD